MRKAVAWITLVGLALCAPFAMLPQQGLPPTEAMINARLDEDQRLLLDTRKQVIIDTQKLADLEARVEEREKSDEPWKARAPGELAVLEARVEDIREIGMGLLGAILSLLVGCSAWAFKQVRTTAAIAARLKAAGQCDLDHHHEVIDNLAAVRTEARCAYAEANSVNRKIENAGLTLATAIREQA